MAIDPALRAALEERGLFDKIAELEGTGPKIQGLGTPRETPAERELVQEGRSIREKITDKFSLSNAIKVFGAIRPGNPILLGANLALKNNDVETAIDLVGDAMPVLLEETRKDPRRVKKSLTEGLKGGIFQTGSAVDTMLALGSDKLGLEEASKEFSQRAKAKREAAMGFEIKDERLFREKIKDPNFIARGLGQNLPNLLFGMGAAVPVAVAGAPAALIGITAFAAGATLEGGFAFQEAKDFGADDATAEKVAGIVGIVNGVFESMPTTKLLSRTPLGRQVKNQVLRIATRAITQISLEGGTETVQEIISNSVARVMFDEQRNILQGTPEAAFFGAIMGGGVSVGVDIVTQPQIREGVAKALQSEEGFFKLPSKDKKIEGEDLQIAEDFIDLTRIKKNEDNRISIERNARFLAEGLGIDPDVSNTVLANRFDDILNIQRQKAQDTALTTEARKFDTAEEFISELTDTTQEQQFAKDIYIHSTANPNIKKFNTDIVSLAETPSLAREFGDSVLVVRAKPNIRVLDLTGGKNRNLLKDIVLRDVSDLSFGKPVAKIRGEDVFELNNLTGTKEQIIEELSGRKTLDALLSRKSPIFDDIHEELKEFALKNNYDAVRIDSTDVTGIGRGVELQVYNKDKIQIIPKTQLTDIFNQAKESDITSEEGFARIPGSNVVPADSKPNITPDLYEENRNFKKGATVTAKRDLVDMKDDLKKGADRLLGVLTTRLANINPTLKKAIREMEFFVRQRTTKDLNSVNEFLQKTKKMSKDDRVDFDLARKNGDAEKIQELIKKYKIGTEYNTVRKTLDDIYKRADDVSYDFGYKEHYHPRIIKDIKGYLQHFRGSKDWSIITDAIKSKEDALQRNLTEDEKAYLINTMVRGYNNGNISLSEIGNMKERTIDVVDGELNQFYMTSDGALLSYIQRANDAIESRKFFGKRAVDLGYQVDDSIGEYTLKLIEQGKITPEQEVELTEMLRARFNPKPMRGLLGVYKNLSYVDTMGSPTSAITQIGDLAWSLYKAGAVKTTGSAWKAIQGKSTITKQDIGIDNIAEEFADPTKSANAVRTVFRLIGLEKIDTIGKETLINAVISKYQDRARKGDPKLKAELEPIFEGQTDEVITDLQGEEITENIKLLAFNTLLDFQPLTLSAMPEQYIKGGQGRIFYMLKSFTLTQFDIFRREVFQQIANPKTRVQGIQNLIKLSAAFILMNATADELKDLLLGRRTSLKDRTVDNVLRLVGFSKFVVYKARMEGIGSATVRQILPPMKFIDAAYKDFFNDTSKGLKTIQSIPLGGKLYYWWFGKGSETKDKRRRPSAAKFEGLDYSLEDLDFSDINLDIQGMDLIDTLDFSEIKI